MASATTATQALPPREQQPTLRLRPDFTELDRQTKRTRHITYSETKEEQRRWQLEQMAGAFRIFAKLGYSDGASGHISLRGIYAFYQSHRKHLSGCRRPLRNTY